MSPLLTHLDGTAESNMVYRVSQALLCFWTLLSFWTGVPFLVARLCSWVLLKLGIIHNRRSLALVDVTLTSAWHRLGRFLRYVSWAGAYGMIGAGTLGKISLPARGTPERICADEAFGIALFFFLTGLVSGEFGMSIKGDALHRMAFMGGLANAIVIYQYPGNLCWIGALAVFASAGLIGWTSLRFTAFSNFHLAPLVREIAPRGGATLHLIHISDVHATHLEGTTDGGSAGSAALLDLARSIETKTARPTYVVVTGDVVDTGAADEWKIPARSLLRIRDCGVRVLLAPGNHDLVPSYVDKDLFRATGGRGFLSRVDGNRLLRYLKTAISLEPRLSGWNGFLIRRQVESYDSRVRVLLECWERARQEAIRITGFRTTGNDHTPFRKLLLRSPASAEKVGRLFSSEAFRVFPEVDAKSWAEYLFRPSVLKIDEAVTEFFWADYWYKLFPLRALSIDAQDEFFILNTTARQPRLARSAMGCCQHEQLDRLEQLFEESRAHNIFVLFHHAPFRWSTQIKFDSAELYRWAFLANDAAESQRLATILKTAAKNGRRIMLLAGHVHGRSRSGILDAQNSQDGSQTAAVWYLESGALGEEGDRSVLAVWQSSDGQIDPGVVSRTPEL